MKKNKKNKLRTVINSKIRDEETDWLYLTPQERFLETTKLWTLYFALGGSLDPEPDPQSPFYF